MTYLILTYKRLNGKSWKIQYIGEHIPSQKEIEKEWPRALYLVKVLKCQEVV